MCCGLNRGDSQFSIGAQRSGKSTTGSMIGLAEEIEGGDLKRDIVWLARTFG